MLRLQRGEQQRRQGLLTSHWWLTAAPRMLPGLPLSLHLSLSGQLHTNIAHACDAHVIEPCESALNLLSLVLVQHVAMTRLITFAH